MKIIDSQTMCDERFFKNKKKQYDILDNIDDFNKNVTIMLQQAALLNSFSLTAAASCFVKQLFFDCCSYDLTLNSNFYILSSFLLYLLFMLLVLVNYTHMTCLYADLDIIKSIHRHQRCKRHT